MLTFSLSVHYYRKWLSFCKICLFLEKMWVFVWRFIYINKVSNSDKKLQFLRICSFVYVLIFIKVFHLLENCYFDSKYHFVQWYFGQECHFPSKIYIKLGINSLEKLSNFLRMVLILGKVTVVFRSILVVNSEKMTICFRSFNFFVICASVVKAKILQKHLFWRIFSFL